MLTVTLPDGKKISFEQQPTIHEVAEKIGPGLAKSALAGKIEGCLFDTSHVLQQDCNLAIITVNSDEGVEIIRHSTAHLLAQATQELFPETQVTIGPVIENGFYYDFARKEKFHPDDIAKIEAKMNQLASSGNTVQRFTLSRDEAIKLFSEKGEHYKAQIIQDIPKNENISLYQQGDFIDLCRGPHVPNTAFLKQKFKLTKLAGAYWRGDSNNEMLQRIYGTAWSNKKDLKTYLHNLAEAEKRDHRKLAKELDLFHTQEEAPGMVFWHPKGYLIYLIIEQYIRDITKQHGYQEVKTPQIIDKSLWQKSGHLDKFSEMMFTTKSENRHYAVKPMNCPGHIQIYNQGLKSYRDLPLRLAEFGSCHRNEPSGTLHGVMRVRNFTQDDGHIFCTLDQINKEVSDFIDLLFKVYSDFGFNEVLIKLSTRPEKRVGSDEDWTQTEQILEKCLNDKNLAWDLQPGEGAFYGPKIEFSLKDCIGRIWQCGTMQIDFSMPKRLDAEYVAESGQKFHPVMLHRAILGSLERFIGILIEEFAGALPVWLAPIQVMIINISQKQQTYCNKIKQDLTNLQFRAETDLRNEKIGLKIREHSLQKIPYLLIIGDNEVTNEQVAVRAYGNKNLGLMNFKQFTDLLNKDKMNKAKNKLFTEKPASH